MSWTLTTSAHAIAKAGAHANSTVTASGDMLSLFSADAESYLCEQTGIDWVSNFSSLPQQIKNALSDAASSSIAMKIVSYDTTGYLQSEADTLLNLNDGIMERNILRLKEIGKGGKLREP